MPYFYDRLDNEIRQRLLTVLSEQYDDLDISVRSAQFVEDEGIEIRDLVIVETGAAGPRAELLRLPEVFLHSQGTLQEVLSGSIAVREVVIRRPVLRMTRRHDASWSCSRLLPFPQFGGGRVPPPKVVVEDATIEIFDPTKNPSSMLVLRNVNLTFSQPEHSSPGDGTSLRQITGMLGGDYVSRVELQGQIDLKSGAWSLGGVVDDLEITQESLHSVPAEWLSGCTIPSSCRARAVFQFALSHGAGEDRTPCRFKVEGTLNEGRMEDPRLPGPLTELVAAFTVSNEGLRVSELEAHSGPTTFRVHSFQSWGHGPAARKSLDGEVERLVLDRNLLAALPNRLAETWSKYLPLGQVNAEFTADYDGSGWQPRTAMVECLDASFSYYKFPYRLHRVRGTLPVGDKLVALNLLKNNVLQIGMEAFSGKNRVTINGTMWQPLSAPYGTVAIRAAELELNEDLFAAMQEEPRKVMESLNPKGHVDVDLVLGNDRPGAPVQKHMIAYVLPGASLRYLGFPYPLTVNGGQIEMTDDQWVFRNFTAQNDTGVVTCNGQFGPEDPGMSENSGKVLKLNFIGKNIALEEELRDSLRHPNMQRLWNDLRLRGMIDLEELTVLYRAATKDLDVTFRAVPDPGLTSIEPVNLPYRLEGLNGSLVYRDGLITVERFEGSHDDTRITAKVTCEFTPDGSWNLRFDDMWVEQLLLDNELARALPDRFRFAVTELDTRTPINLGGSVHVGRNAAQFDRLLSAWDLNVVFHRAHLNCGVPIDNVSGKAILSGQSNGETFVCRGELDNCLFMYRDIQVTKVTGPILIDDQRVLLGSSVPPPAAGQRPRPLQGMVFGGWAYGEGVVALGKDTGYRLSGKLFEAELSRAAQELVSGRQNLQGKVIARIDLTGHSKTVNAMEGRGNIQLHNADIYELPVMVSLLKILTIRRPDNNAFSESNIDFLIKGDHIYFPKIVFSGDAISLEGAGEMDANRNVNLQLGTRLGRGELGMTFLRDVLGGAGDQIVLIHVDGPVSNPRIVRQPLPAVNNLIEQLQKDLQIPVESPGLFPQGGTANSYGRATVQR